MYKADVLRVVTQAGAVYRVKTVHESEPFDCVTPRLLRPAWVYGAGGELRRYNRSGPRCAEIIDWLRRHPEVTSFVILDDDSDMACAGHRLVKTTYQTGLTGEHVEQAVKILGGVPHARPRQL